MIELGEKVGALLVPFLQKLTNVIGGVISWFDKLTPSEQQAIVTFLAVAAAIGPVLIGVGKMVEAVGSLAKAWSLGMKLVDMATKGTLIGVVLAVVILVATLIITHWHQVKEVLAKVWNAIKTAAEKVWRDALLPFFKLMGISIFALLTGGIGPLVVWFVHHWNTIKTDAQAAWNAIIGWLKGIPGRIIGLFADAGRWLFNAGRAILNGLWDGLKSVWNGLTGWISGIGNWISSHKGPESADYALLQPHGRAIMQGLADGMRANFGAVSGAVGEVSTLISGASGGSLTAPMLGAGPIPAAPAVGALGAPLRAYATAGPGVLSGAPQGGRPVVVNVTVQGSVTAERDLADAIRSRLLRVGLRNGGRVGLS